MIRATAALWRLLRARAARGLRDWRRPKGGPAGRLRRRLVLGGTLLAALSALLAFPDAAARQAGRLCGVGIGQPALGDACASWGVPGVASRPERLAWGKVEPGDCEGLRRHVRDFPRGAFGEEARQKLRLSRWQRADDWTPLRRETSGYIGQSEPLPARAAALAAALAEVEKDAREQGCRPVDEHERFEGVELLGSRPDCRQTMAGFVCGLDYRAACRMRTRKIEEVCG